MDMCQKDLVHRFRVCLALQEEFVQEKEMLSRFLVIGLQLPILM